MEETSSFSLAAIAGSRFPLLEYAPDATVIVDTEGTIRLINAQAERLFGYYREELMGLPVERLLPERFHEEHVRHRADYASDPHVRQMGAELELFARRKNGDEFPIEVSLSPIMVKEGQLFAAAIRDVSERKAFAAHLRELHSQLEEATRSKDRFLGIMSHHLRTPLNAIIGFTGTLLMAIPGQITQEQERQLKIIQWSSRHLLSLIDDVLDLATVRSGGRELVLERVLIHDVVRDVAASLTEFAGGKGLELGTFVPEEAQFVVTDRRSLRQILLNLTNNAIKYTESGSVLIEVRAASHDGDRAISVNVTDTGIGIRSEDRVRLFGAFERMDEGDAAPEGTGLGLHLSRNLARLLGAELTFVSEVGKGSTFTLTIPG